MDTDDLGTLVEAYNGFIAPFGMSHYALGEIDLQDRRRSAMVIASWPPEWLRYYTDSKLIERDPLFAALQKADGPMSWSDIRDNPVSRGDRQLFIAAAEFGWNEGFVVALRRGGTRRGLISLCGPRERLPREDYGALTAGSVLFYERVRGQLAGAPSVYMAAGLTQREVECLTGAAAGLSDAGIAQRLGISAATVHEHIERAKRRFGVRSRTAAVAVAVSLQLVQP